MATTPDFTPYRIPADQKGYRDFKALARYGRWLVVYNGLKYIVHNGPDSEVRSSDFRYGFNTFPQACDRAFSADNADKGIRW